MIKENVELDTLCLDLLGAHDSDHLSRLHVHVFGNVIRMIICMSHGMNERNHF